MLAFPIQQPVIITEHIGDVFLVNHVLLFGCLISQSESKARVEQQFIKLLCEQASIIKLSVNLVHSRYGGIVKLNFILNWSLLYQ